MVQTHSGRARRMTYGFQKGLAFPGGDANCPFRMGGTLVLLSVLPSQNETRTLWRALMLGWRPSATIEFLHAQNEMQTLANPNGEQSTVHQCNSGSATPRLCIQRNPRATCEPVVAHTHSGLAKLMFAVAEDGHPMVHTQSGLAKPTHAGSERNADPMLHTHSGLAKPRSCSPSRKCEPHGVHTHSRRNR